jgi:transmembrane sensor
MTGDQHDIVPILVKYALRQTLSESEERVMATWRERSAEHAVLPERFRDKQWLEEQRKLLHPPPAEAMWADIRAYIDAAGDPPPVVIMPTRRRIGLGWCPVAVLLLVAVVYGGMRFVRHDARRSVSTVTGGAATLPNYQALLTLDDGSQILLDTLRKGAMVVEGSLWLRKTDSNSYVYNMRASAESSGLHRLVLAPTSRVTRLQWPDGSSAWLKGGSSLEYAVDLRSAVVKVEGEAWFRLAHNPSQPATIVLADGSLVRVLGTSFDVRSVAGDPGSRVALFSGKVRVVKGNDSLDLRPGWQVHMGGQHLGTGAVDSANELAWVRPAVKDSDFLFENADLLQIMPAIAAWFRVTVVNPKQVRGEGISGDFLRTMPLPVLIDKLNEWEAEHARINLRKDTIFIIPLKPDNQKTLYQAINR